MKKNIQVFSLLLLSTVFCVSAKSTKNSIKETVQNVTHTAKETGQQASDTASEYYTQAKESTQEHAYSFSNSVKETAHNVSDSVKESWHSFTDWITGKSNKLQEHIPGTVYWINDSSIDWKEINTQGYSIIAFKNEDVLTNAAQKAGYTVETVSVNDTQYGIVILDESKSDAIKNWISEQTR